MAWVLDVFLNSIEPSCVNGVGALWKKVRLFGIKLLVRSMGEKKGVGYPRNKGGVWCGALEGN